MEMSFDFQVIADNILSFMVGRYPHGPLGGLALTLLLAVYSMVFSLLGGVVLGILCTVQNRWVRWPVSGVMNILRGVPLLMVIFWMYFLMPALFGKGFPENTTVIVALSVFTSAYISQIVKAGIESIPRGQVEAALSSGLNSRQALQYVVLPQALRNMVPSFVNQFVSLIKDTSLAFIVGVSELTHVANQVNNRTITSPTEVFIFIAILYFLICFAFTSVAKRLETRSSRA